MWSISSRRLAPAVLFAILLARKEQVPRSARLWAHIAVAALFANAVPYLLFAVAEQSVNSSTAGIINATMPPWTVALALLLGPRSRPAPARNLPPQGHVRRGGRRCTHLDLHPLASRARPATGSARAPLSYPRSTA